MKRTIRCKRCKQIFEFEGAPPICCDNCKTAEAEQFVMVRELVKDHPGITALEASEQTGVAFATIMQYVARGDLEVVQSENPVGDVDLALWLSRNRIVGDKDKLLSPDTSKTLPMEDIDDPKSQKSRLRFHDGNEDSK